MELLLVEILMLAILEVIHQLRELVTQLLLLMAVEAEAPTKEITVKMVAQVAVALVIKVLAVELEPSVKAIMEEVVRLVMVLQVAVAVLVRWAKVVLLMVLKMVAMEEMVHPRI